MIVYAELAQLGEHLPYKQEVIGSSPIFCIVCVAQLVEQWLVVPPVAGSSPVMHLIWLLGLKVTTPAFQVGNIGFNSHRGHFCGYSTTASALVFQTRYVGSAPIIRFLLTVSSTG